MTPLGGLIGRIPILRINKNFHNAKGKLDAIVYNMIKEHRVNENMTDLKQSFDLLYTLLNAQDTESGID